jgi:hypothetical protein
MNFTNNYLNELTNNNITKEQAEEIQYEPISDADIRYYFPNSRVMTVNELSDFNHINDLFPKPYGHVFLLYQQSKNNGHWVLLSKYDNIIEYFDSYGGFIDEPYRWTGIKARRLLGEGIPYLTIMLRNTKYDVIYNGYDFQNAKNGAIATCGRWCILRLKTILKNKMHLNYFIKMMKQLKKSTKLSYDEIVSDLINKTE